jgi:hypothetical protein
MFGPGEYGRNAAEGIMCVEDLPKAKLIRRSRNYKRQPCSKYYSILRYNAHDGWHGQKRSVAMLTAVPATEVDGFSSKDQSTIA